MTTMHTSTATTKLSSSKLLSTYLHTLQLYSNTLLTSTLYLQAMQHKLRIKHCRQGVFIYQANTSIRILDLARHPKSLPRTYS